MKVSLKKAFSLLDGRLSTEIGDVYEMLNYIFDDNLMTHQLPTAMRKLQEVNPGWFERGVFALDEIKRVIGTDDFQEMIETIDKDFSHFEIELGKVNFKTPFFAGIVKADA